MQPNPALPRLGAGRPTVTLFSEASTLGHKHWLIDTNYLTLLARNVSPSKTANPWYMCLVRLALACAPIALTSPAINQAISTSRYFKTLHTTKLFSFDRKPFLDQRLPRLRTENHPWNKMRRAIQGQPHSRNRDNPLLVRQKLRINMCCSTSDVTAAMDLKNV